MYFNLKNKKLSKISYILVIMLFIVFFSVNTYAYISNENLKIFAVNSSSVAMDANLNIEIQEGSGKIYTSINSSIGTSTQESARNAVLVTEKYVDNIKDKYDYFFDIQSSAASVDGPSAGAAMAFLLINMHQDKDVNNNISITGTITADGYVGDVGGVYEKSQKANEVGIDLFFIPKGNREQMVDINGEVKLIDLVNYAYNNWDMKIIEVDNIEDVLYYSSLDYDEIDINATNNKENDDFFIPEKIDYSKSLEPMRKIVDEYVEDSNQTLIKAEKSVKESIIKESNVTQQLLSYLNFAKSYIKDAKVYSNKNYLYTAANNSFIAKVYSTTVDEIVTNPSILNKDSTVFSIKLEELEEKITAVEKRSKSCKLNSIEWCIGAKQRITWSKNKLNSLKETNNITLMQNIQDYSYALSWIEIANDFLDIGMNDQGPIFVESPYFKDFAQEKIVDLENQMVLIGSSSQNEDLLRRVNAAKTDYKKGWYVTSLYDSASAMAVLETIKEQDNEFFNKALYNKNLEDLLTKLRTTKNIKSSTNIWSKLYLDHALFFNKKAEYYENKSKIEYENNLKTSNSILNISKNLYFIEEKVLDYYNNANISEIITEIEDVNNTNIQGDISKEVSDKDDKTSNIYIYSKQNKDITYIYLILAAFVIIIAAIVVKLEKYTNKKKILKDKISELDEKLLDGTISEYTYKELRHKYLIELHNMKNANKSLDTSISNKSLLAKKMSSVHPSLVVYNRNKTKSKKTKSKKNIKKNSTKLKKKNKSNKKK
jgi:predicted S18 family serine protease